MFPFALPILAFNSCSTVGLQHRNCFACAYLPSSNFKEHGLLRLQEALSCDDSTAFTASFTMPLLEYLGCRALSQGSCKMSLMTVVTAIYQIPGLLAGLLKALEQGVIRVSLSHILHLFLVKCLTINTGHAHIITPHTHDWCSNFSRQIIPGKMCKFEICGGLLTVICSLKDICANAADACIHSFEEQLLGQSLIVSGLYMRPFGFYAVFATGSRGSLQQFGAVSGCCI